MRSFNREFPPGTKVLCPAVKLLPSFKAEISRECEFINGDIVCFVWNGDLEFQIGIDFLHHDE